MDRKSARPVLAVLDLPSFKPTTRTGIHTSDGSKPSRGRAILTFEAEQKACLGFRDISLLRLLAAAAWDCTLTDASMKGIPLCWIASC
jgi:hypothetical protein